MTERPSASSTPSIPSPTVVQRWLLAYLVLYIAPFPLNFVPGLDALTELAAIPWQTLVTWIGAAVFGVETVPRHTGSGDTMFNTLQMACMAALAVPLALVWPRSARTPVAWDRILDRTYALMRLYLGCYLLIYGLGKAIPCQFPPAGPDRLIVPYGDSSPMGLLWTFMGASPAYESFTGVIEALAGVLLFWRRTTALGALLAATALTQVLALNLCYDVPVKQFSAHLLLVALYILAPDVSRLLDVLWFHRPASPRPLAPHPIARPGLRRAVMAARVGIIAWIACITTSQSLGFWMSTAEPGPLHGVYRVVSFQRGSGPVSDEIRWARVGINTLGIGAIQRADGSGERYGLTIDDDQKTLTWKQIGGDASERWTYTEPGPDELLLEGSVDGATTVVRLRRVEAPFLLTSRGFRWVQERPFNR